MEQEKMTEKDEIKESKNESSERYYHHRPRFLLGGLIVIIGLLILFGTFMLGARVNRVRTVGVTSFTRGAEIGTMNGMRGGFGGRVGGPIGEMRGANRVLGSLTTINGNTLTVHTNAKDYTVTVSSTTSFYSTSGIAKQSDLKTGDIVTVSGTPDSSGNIAATVINID